MAQERVTVRGDATWVRWVEDLADHCYVTAATVIDQALRRYAEGVGFHQRCPTRVARRRSVNTDRLIRAERQRFYWGDAGDAVPGP